MTVNWFGLGLMLKIVLTGIICMGAGTLFGITANRIFRLSFTAPELPADGVVIMLGVLECLTWSVTTFRLSWAFLYAVTFCVITAGCESGICFLWRKREKERLQSPSMQVVHHRQDDGFHLYAQIILLVLLALLMIFLSEYFYKPDADDAFYVSNVNLFLHSDRINQYDSSFGISSLGTVPMYDFQIWETFSFPP